MFMTIRALFARNLRSLRQERGLSQEALARAADIDRIYISGLERGTSGATIDMVDKLALVLGVEPAALLQRPRVSRRTKG